jgi:hypothetical protein
MSFRRTHVLAHDSAVEVGPGRRVYDFTGRNLAATRVATRAQGAGGRFGQGQLLRFLPGTQVSPVATASSRSSSSFFSSLLRTVSAAFVLALEVLAAEKPPVTGRLRRHSVCPMACTKLGLGP